MFRTSNPLLSQSTFDATRQGRSWTDSVFEAGQAGRVKPAGGVMTMSGTVRVAFLLVGLCVAGASGSWMVIEQNRGLALPLSLGGALAAFVMGLIVAFKPRAAPVLGVPFALAEGAFLGAISLFVAERLNARVPGMGMTTVAQAVGLTFSIFVALLAAYSFRLVRLGSTAKKVVIMATLGVALLYLASFVLRLFGVSVPFIHDASPIGIAFSGFVVVLASLNLVLDFQFIDETASAGDQPKFMEWAAAVGLLGTLVWLYIEVLRLLMKIREMQR